MCRVKNWALKFGIDLWAFGKEFTKMNEIQRVCIYFCVVFACVIWTFINFNSLVLQKYQVHEARVVKKDGLILIRDMASEVKNMMDIKMNSIMVKLSLDSLVN